MLEMGLFVASADGDVGDEEVDHITRFLESQFLLDPPDARRLEALKQVLMNRTPSLTGVGKRLQAVLTVEQREVVGRFLVGIAAANGTIDRKEITALRRAYKALGVDVGPAEPAPRRVPPGHEGAGRGPSTDGPRPARGGDPAPTGRRRRDHSSMRTCSGGSSARPTRWPACSERPCASSIQSEAIRRSKTRPADHRHLRRHSRDRRPQTPASRDSILVSTSSWPNCSHAPTGRVTTSTRWSAAIG